MMTRPVRLAVTGAAGRISYALLFRVAAGAMFGPDQAVELRLLDVPETAPLMEATIMELHDCALPLLAGVRMSTDAAEAFAGADWVIMIASVPYHQEMSRWDMLRANAPIFLHQGETINETA